MAAASAVQPDNSSLKVPYQKRVSAAQAGLAEVCAMDGHSHRHAIQHADQHLVLVAGSPAHGLWKTVSDDCSDALTAVRVTCSGSRLLSLFACCQQRCHRLLRNRLVTRVPSSLALRALDDGSPLRSRPLACARVRPEGSPAAVERVCLAAWVGGLSAHVPVASPVSA